LVYKVDKEVFGRAFESERKFVVFILILDPLDLGKVELKRVARRATDRFFLLTVVAYVLM
jgi:hypothetical protein